MPDPLVSATPCPECGALRAPGQTRCDLCGFSETAAAASQADAARMDAPAPGAAPSPEGVFCNACGWRNPAGARFCSQCGAPLQTDAAPRPAPARPPAAAAGRAPSNAPLGRTLGIVLAAAVLLVVALYVVTAISKKQAPPPPAAAAAQEAPPADAALFTPLSADQEKAVMALEGDLKTLEGEPKLARQRELVNLLIGFGRPDLAAQAQQDLARLDPSAEAWTRTGDLYFQWMNLVEESGGAPQPPATRAIAAYDEALKTRDDLDVRARLAWAAQYDSSQPMRAIEETKAVLEKDSLHVGALQNYAIFLARIGRTDQAIAQMDRIRRHAGSDTLLARSAEAFIEALKERDPPIAP